MFALHMKDIEIDNATATKVDSNIVIPGLIFSSSYHRHTKYLSLELVISIILTDFED